MKQTEWTDAQIKAALRKDGPTFERAVEYVYKAWYRYLASAAEKAGAMPEEVEEAVSEAVWQLARRVVNTDAGEIEHLKTYAYRIAFNQANARRKSRKETDALDPAFLTQSDESEKNKTQLRLAVHETENELEKMGEPCRTILLMRGWGYSSEDIAAKTGLAESTVKNKTGFCREELIRRLGGKPF